MKRIIILLTAIGLALGLHAQSAPDADSLHTADSLWWDAQPRVSLELGLRIKGTLLSHDNEGSPYYSRYGFGIEVPLMLGYRVSPHWKLSGGVMVDLCWRPFYYSVKTIPTPDDGSNGIDFATTATSGHSFPYAFRTYVGIPIEATWYPWKRDPGVLGVKFDLFAGYDVFILAIEKNTLITRDNTGIQIEDDSDYLLMPDDPTLLPWRLEAGITLQTNVIGLIHGVRFFVNFLPTYHDPLADDYLFEHGMTIYL